jgi:hypothetical protein
MAYVEQDCAYVHQGRAFTSGGAIVTPEWAVGYLDKRGGRHVVTTWHGAELGPARIVATWRTPTSYVSDRMHQVEATIGGIRYTGRTAGTGMIWKGRRMARQAGEE